MSTTAVIASWRTVPTELDGRASPGDPGGPREQEQINADSGLTALLAVVVGQSAFYVDSCASSPRYDYLAKNLVRRSLIRTSSGWVLLAGLNRRDLWSYLSSRPSEDEELVERFLRDLGELQQTGVCAAPQLSTVAEGVSLAVREGGRTVAAVSVVGPHDEIRSRRDELVAMLQDRRRGWELGDG